jgi:hypothetical protein
VLLKLGLKIYDIKKKNQPDLKARNSVRVESVPTYVIEDALAKLQAAIEPV